MSPRLRTARSVPCGQALGSASSATAGPVPRHRNSPGPHKIACGEAHALTSPREHALGLLLAPVPAATLRPPQPAENGTTISGAPMTARHPRTRPDHPADDVGIPT